MTVILKVEKAYTIQEAEDAALDCEELHNALARDGGPLVIESENPRDAATLAGIILGIVRKNPGR